MHAATELPSFLYGTAWKEERTAGLVELALQQGFRGIDTANQRKHYFEAVIGEAARSPARNCSYRPSSPTARGRTSACPTTQMHQSVSRCGSPVPARSSTCAPTTLTHTCCTDPANGQG